MYATLSNYVSFTKSEKQEKEHFQEKEMPLLLNLIIYNPSSSHEQEMKSILTPYLEKVPRLTFYYIAFRNQSEAIIVDEQDHTIWVKGTEGFIPGILEKTMVAMKHLRERPYDYLIRSNISTVINWSNFPTEEIKDHGYSSANVLRFLPGLPFAQGTNIILRRDRAEYLMDHEKEMDWTIIDDVAIAQLLIPLGIYQLELPIQVNSETPYGFVYRNRTDGNRGEDVARMKRLVERLMADKK
jgi:hypothetical protein